MYITVASVFPYSSMALVLAYFSKVLEQAALIAETNVSTYNIRRFLVRSVITIIIVLGNLCTI